MSDKLEDRLSEKIDDPSTGIFQVQCFRCRRKRDNTLSCDAFSKIPYEILSGKADHRKPFPGDGGKRFIEK